MSASRDNNTECSPLLPKAKTRRDAPVECHEISRSTRHSILVALWAGTFFCVS
ncbi:hypothetical protein J3R82DRAFT_1622 [Butyriboletus roseoflavus]|nr:hypothetical protein J3R82DRAFT_1622 [Butyriboletus roseoflavus]